MNSYILINITLTATALSINHYMKIPHRCRFYILMVAVLAWLTPFGLMTIELSQQTLQMLSLITPAATESVTNGTSTRALAVNWVIVFSALITIGWLRFCIDVAALHTRIKQLSIQSTPYKGVENIRLVDGIHGAFITGYLKPVIWIDKALVHAETLPTVITHEQQHIQSHDQIWLLIITLTQRLMWFNPLTNWACLKARQSIELSCDEACKNQLGQQVYQTALAKLALLQHPNQSTPLINHINHNGHFNIHRIKQLEQDNTMNKQQRLKLTSVIALSAIMGLYSLLTFAKQEPMPRLEAGQVFIELKVNIGDAASKNMSLIINHGETAEVQHDSYYFTLKPNVLQLPENSTKAQQILIKMSLAAINDKDSRTTLSNPSMLVLNNSWAGFKMDESTDNDVIHLEIRTTVKQ